MALSCTLTLQRGQLIGWGGGLLLAGLAFGSMTKSLLNAAQENELLAPVLAVSGTGGVDTTMSQVPGGSGRRLRVTAVLRTYNDEESGLSEPVLAAAVSRWQWLLTSVAAALTGVALLLFCAGLGSGLGAGLTVGEAAPARRLTLAGLAFLPAMAVLAAVAAPRSRCADPGSAGWPWHSSWCHCISVRCCGFRSGCWTPRPSGRPPYPPISRSSRWRSWSSPRPGLCLVAGLIYRNRDAAAGGSCNETHLQTIASMLFGLVFFGVALFLPAWTFDYWLGVGFHRGLHRRLHHSEFPLAVRKSRGSAAQAEGGTRPRKPVRLNASSSQPSFCRW